MKPVPIVSAALMLVALLFVPNARAQGGCCVLPDNGNGTVDMIPTCSSYGPMIITGGLPPTTSILIEAQTIDVVNVLEIPGGSLGGTEAFFSEILQMEMTGTGILAGFNRTLFVPMNGSVHTGPRVPGDAVQDFDTDIFQMEGQLFGDPDFEILRVEKGTAFGLPSPGHTTLTRLGPPGSEFAVDSFFDVAYRIEYQGAPGSILEGFGGITEDQSRFDLCPISTSVPAPLPECCTTWSEIKKMFD